MATSTNAATTEDPPLGFPLALLTVAFFLPLTTLLDSKVEETARIASSVPTVLLVAEVFGNCPFVAFDVLVLVEEDVSNSLA